MSLETIWTTLYCVNLFLLFPLFLRHGYLDIMEAKTGFFLVTTIIYIIGTGAIYIIKKSQTGDNIFLLKRVNLADICNMILFVTILLNAILNKMNTEILWAKEGKHFGFVFLIVCMLGSFCIARTFQMNQGVLWGILLGNIITSLLVICSRFGIDIFHLYDIIVKNQRSAFLGTLGQINVVASFFCVFIPFWMGCYLSAKERSSKILFGLALLLSVMAGICSNSDSIFLGILGGYIFYLWFAFNDFKRLSAYFQCISLLFLSAVFIGIFTYLAKQNLHFIVKWDALQQQIFKYSLVWLVVAIFSGIFSVILKKVEWNYSLVKIRKLFFCAIIIILILGIMLFVVNNSRLSGSDIFKKYIVFGDSWGSNRGYVWKRTIKLFGQLPLGKKIIGCGMGMFPSFFEAFHTDSMNHFGYYFVDAHNEFLQFLTTTGIAGCISYFGIIIATIIENLLVVRKGRLENELSMIVPAVLFVWLLQGLVNSPTVFITPYLFLFLGIGGNAVTE